MRMEVYGEHKDPEGGEKCVRAVGGGGGDVCFPLKTDVRGVRGG